MNGGPDRERDSGISRRDFVLGRLLQEKARKSTGGVAASSTAANSSIVMRYPRSLEDVAAADPPASAESPAATTAAESRARRRAIPVLRPPGAIDEPSFLAGCTRCEQCLEACPHNAIVHAPERLREAAGTPIIDADRQPCLMCADFPCIAACEPGVLTHQVAKMMGTAKITEHLCLPHHGTSCTVCSEHCPVDGAIVLTAGKPVVAEAICTGCGVCRSVCPAPENAILLMPTFLRPSTHSEHQRQ